MDQGSARSEKTNIEKLVDFTNEEGPELIPAFLALIEMCFYGHEDSFQKV